MDGSARNRGVPGETVRDLRAVLEDLELLWEREVNVDAPVVVSPSQLRVLYVLEREPGLNLRELGSMIGSAPSALSRLCARLEAMGFVRRLPSTQSGREIELHLTGHATAYLVELRERRERALARALDSVPPARFRPLAEGVAALRLSLNARLGAPGGGWGIRSA
jgi:DNA-binding MarR family transcriptional regulator